MPQTAEVSCGGEHTLFLTAAGKLLSAGACGLGWRGSLPDAQVQATLDRRASPCAVAGYFRRLAGGAVAEAVALPPIEKAVGGYYHNLAISRSGQLYSWGCGNFDGENDGQLGLGGREDLTSAHEVKLPGLQAGEVPRDAATGCYHSAVLTSAGRVFTFGLNNYGQLGRAGVPAGAAVPRSPEAGSTDYSDGTPQLLEVPAAAAAAAAKISAIGAGFYNVYLLSCGRPGVLCAGSNAAGQCGTADATASRPGPIPELAGQALAQVTGEYCHTLALAKASGQVFSLGCGEDGQRWDLRHVDDDDDDDDDGPDNADRAAAPEFVPSVITAVALPGAASAVAAGANHSLALAADGSAVWGWGSNEHGQLGVSVAADKLSQPTRLALPAGVVAISAGYAHTAVRMDDGRVLTWGAGSNGQLGHGTEAVDSAVPAAADIAGAGHQACGH